MSSVEEPAGNLKKTILQFKDCLENFKDKPTLVSVFNL